MHALSVLMESTQGVRGTCRGCLHTHALHCLQELLGFLRKALSQQAPVRAVLYGGMMEVRSGGGGVIGAAHLQRGHPCYAAWCAGSTTDTSPPRLMCCAPVAGARR